MRKIREGMRLHYDCGLGQRATARSLSISHSTVQTYLERAREAGLSWPIPDDLDDEALERMMFPPAPTSERQMALPDWAKVHEELKQPGVTRQLVWQEYRSDHPEGYGYSRFCDMYRAWSKRLDPTMRMHHKAGDKAFSDYAGMKAHYLDPETHEIQEASLFVTTLGASSDFYAEVQPNEQLQHWIGGHVNAFNSWGGVPAAIVVDNLKTGVKHPCRYDPDLNPGFR